MSRRASTNRSRAKNRHTRRLQRLAGKPNWRAAAKAKREGIAARTEAAQRRAAKQERYLASAQDEAKHAEIQRMIARTKARAEREAARQWERLQRDIDTPMTDMQWSPSSGRV